MRKTILIFLLLVGNYRLPAQSKVLFDRLSFTEPLNWTLTDKGTYRTYSHVNNAGTTFCILSVYSSTPSSGNTENDFRNAWKSIVTSNFTVIKNVKPQQKINSNGISYLQDEANGINSGSNFFLRLLVFDLKDKIQPVLFMSGNKQSLNQFDTDLDNFITSIQQGSLSNTLATTGETGAAQTTGASAAGNNNQSNSTNLSNSSGLTHFNHFLFVVPAGWKTVQQNGILLMAPGDLATNEMLSYMFLPPVNSLSFENVIQTTLDDIAGNLGGALMNEVSPGPGQSQHFEKEIEGKSFKGWEYCKGYGHVMVPHGNTDPYGSDKYKINLFLVKVNSRMERLVWLSKDVHEGVKESTTDQNPKYHDVIREFCFSLRFDDWTDAPAIVGKVTRKGISSVWSGLNMYVNGTPVIFTSTVQNTYLIFFDNGQVYFSSKFPYRGLDNLNTLIEAEWSPRLWGTYTFQNGSGTIKLPFATMPFKLNGNKLVTDYMKANHDYVQYPSVDNSVYTGNWCGSGEVYGTNACISFTTDGKFTDQGVVRALEHSLNDYYVATPESGNGIYEIKNNSIIFHFSTGTVFKTAFTGMYYQAGNPSPHEIHLGYNEEVFEKK
ncbi:MAG: hypothetical protein Q8941_16775 [Bacteroidota bacterium]|nr:hypothetical protein [Bacteroidota bacterium]